MEKKISGRVPQKDDGLTLEIFLKARLCLSKNEISRAKFRENGICINGERRKINTSLKAGDLVEVLLETQGAVSKKLPASTQKISVLYEDADVIVINKPSGVSAHPVGKNDQDTLANRLAYYLQSKGEGSVIRILGRLDKDTSGVILSVKNRAAATRLERQRKCGLFFKTYLAITEGIPCPLNGKIKAPLTPNPKNQKQMCVSPNGKFALTHYETLTVKNKYALVLLRPETGRTHQIRVHMASLGCPLLGDPLYGNGPAPEMKRTALHARRIHFLQPFTEEEIQIEAPVPEDIRLIFSSEIRNL